MGCQLRCSSRDPDHQVTGDMRRWRAEEAMTTRTGRRGGARERVVQAAVTLIARHGVEGTSLQMIADELGVTKAAVYHQFQTKEDIVVAVVRPIFGELVDAVGAAERQPTRAAQVDAGIRGLIDVLLRHREIAAAFAGDPVIFNVVHADAELNGLIERMGLLLAGPDPDPATRIAVSLVGSGVAAGAADPALADLDDDTLRHGLLACARRALALPENG
jgi:AcrR family transcriptional regulator